MRLSQLSGFESEEGAIKRSTDISDSESCPDGHDCLKLLRGNGNLQLLNLGNTIAESQEEIWEAGTLFYDNID
ncbi:hypothetical protein NC653_021688 [Populus alba x Populus x berolinensis]|uniref:Uncharacterized protein n=1 Tax=Populus alba x Populus x berolinensis TaxID=444605 RepID=A0AAD6MNX2_9ROSI|nr:hypothetical protein NC653_021688 [Populus alba x Populus x berolinensis]